VHIITNPANTTCQQIDAQVEGEIDRISTQEKVHVRWLLLDNQDIVHMFCNKHLFLQRLVCKVRNRSYIYCHTVEML